MTLPDTSTWLGKLAFAVASAATIAGSSTIISNKIDNVRQDEQLKQVTAVISQLDELNDHLIETDRNLAILNERIKRNLEVPSE